MTNFPDGLADRRDNHRIHVDIPVVYELVDITSNTLKRKTALVTNISITGIFFQSDEVLPLGTDITLTLQLPKINHQVNAHVKIVRVELLDATTNRYGIGCAFTELAEESRQLIRETLIERLDINRLLELTIKRGASDLHLLANQPPVIRIQGEIQILDAPPLSSDEIPKLLYGIMSAKQMQYFEKEKELDFAIQFDTQHRFRVNAHQQRGFMEATLRLIKTKVPSFDELRLPEIIKELTQNNDGLILIVGTTGSGKTTTMAAMIDYINQHRRGVIITLERPIEYTFQNNKSVIKQREIGIDTASFSAALKSTLRQDPNVIVIGEIDDFESIRTAIIAAEAGHLVIASFHAPSTLQAIDRLVSMFSRENRKQLLFQLSNCLRGIICQLLIPGKDKHRRVLATEIVIANDAVKHVIRNDELLQLPTIIQTGSNAGMQSMGDSIARYFELGEIDGTTARLYSEEFKKSLHSYR